jgi:hypothetical protein
MDEIKKRYVRCDGNLRRTKPHEVMLLYQNIYSYFLYRYLPSFIKNITIQIR